MSFAEQILVHEANYKLLFIARNVYAQVERARNAMKFTNIN